MSGSAFAVTHHAFSSGAGRTSDGNGSHASTLKSPSYTKSVSWQHYPGADNPFAIPLSAVVGIPLYIRAEAVIPLASVLMTKGMGLGALMALIIGSAGASLTEVILLKSMFRMPMIAAFLTVILGMAILMGYLTQLLF
nr:permease [Shigella flexneri]